MNEIKRRKKEANYLLLISKIISEEVTNSNINSLTVVDAKLSNDGSHLKIYVVFDGSEKKSLEALNATKGFIRSQLANYVQGRKVPNIHFEIDQISKKTIIIDQILEQIKKQQGEK